MDQHQTALQPIVLVLYAGSFMALAVAVLAIYNHRGAASRYFMGAMLAVALWAFSDAAFFSFATTDVHRWLWTEISFSSSMMSVPVIFTFALYFARLDYWFTAKTRVLLWTPFVVAIVLTITNRWHGLIWDLSVPPLQLSGAAGYGAYFYFMLPVSYGLSLAAVVIFLQSFWRLHALYRRQAIVLSIAVLLPTVSSILYFTPLNPFPGVDLAPAVFSATGVLLLYGMTQLRILDLRPIYRDAVFEHMSEGAVILDGAGRIVDINPAAQQMLAPFGQTLGDDAQTALACSFALTGALDLSPSVHHFLMTPEQPPRYFDLRVAAIGGQPDMLLLIWRDMTRLHAALATIHKQEYYLAARARAEAELKRDIERTVVTVRAQVQNALNHMERGMLSAAALVLAELNTVTTEGMLRRTETFLATGIQADDFLLTIRQYVTNFAELHELKLAIDFDHALSTDHLPPTLRLHVVRVLQTLLDNVAGHAQAQQLNVQLTCTPDGVRLTVRDDGVGFDPAAFLPGRANAGFTLLQQRLDLLNGSLSITAAPGRGVEVCALFPLVPALAALRGRRVVLAAEHPLTREGVRAMLIEHGMTVDAVASYQDMLLALPPAPPDLVLLDIDLPGAAAPATVQQVRATWPETRVVVLLEEGHPSLSVAFHNGADGYVLKTLPTAAFFDALAQAIHGESTLAPDLATQLLSEFRQHDNSLPNSKSLTARQREILQLIARGQTNDQIAARLHISVRTVRYHVEQLRIQLGLANRSQLAIFARRQHL